MMLSRVKPLHIKVEQTSKALEEAVEKLGGMENKLKVIMCMITYNILSIPLHSL